MQRRPYWAGVTALVAAGALLVPLGPGAAAEPTTASGGASGSYIVVLKPGADPSTAVPQAAVRYGLKISAVYSHALKGFAATVPDSQLGALRADPGVAYVEPDQTVKQPADPSATLSGALRDTAAGALSDSAARGDNPQSCLRANAANQNPARLQLCIAGKSMLSIAGVQPGAARPARATGTPGGGEAAMPTCRTTRGDDRCEAWVARFNHSSLSVFEAPFGIAVSPTGNRVFVGGLSWDVERGEQTMAILAYDGRTGRRDWASLPFTGAGGGCGGCSVAGIAVSPDGTRVYVTGYTQNSGTYADIRTLALDATSGAVVWDQRYNRPASYISLDVGQGIAVSPDGSRVYVTGYTADPFNYGATLRNVLIGYEARTGRRQWTHLGPGHDVYDRIRTAGDRVYTTGSGLTANSSHFGAVTVATDGRTGAQLWRSIYDGGSGAVFQDNGLDLAVSPTGNRVYMTGYTTTGAPNSSGLQLSWLTAAYAAEDGRSLWTRRYAGRPGQQAAHEIAASPTGDRVYAAGYVTGRDGYFKPAAVAYDAATGAQAWTQTYDPKRYTGGRMNGVAVSPDGTRVYLTGYHSNAAAGFDYLTMALDAANGGDHWVARYNSAGRSRACLSADGGFYLGLSPDGRRVYSAGIFNPYYNPNPIDFGTLAYDTAGGVANPRPGPIPAPPASECPQLLPWGVDRIDADVSSTRAGNGSGAVTGVNAYDIGTGIDPANPELNVVKQVNFTIGPNYDCSGYGTAVAGVIGARDNAVGVVGVAPGVPLTGVKVLDCSGVGTLHQVIAGVDWVTANAVKPAVANMSLMFAPSRAIDDAVTASADSGIFYTVPAGDFGASCEEVSPARIGTHPGVMTVAATDQSGAEAGWSNFGPCVSIWAPGEWVLTTRLHGGDTFAFGTGFAAPHVAGTAALYLSHHPRTSPAALKQILERDAVLTGFTSKDGTTPVREVYAGKY